VHCGQVLWIGCSDSRCPETTICDGEPGDIFTTRNIAKYVTAYMRQRVCINGYTVHNSLVKLDDPSVQAVIDYSVNVVKVDYSERLFVTRSSVFVDPPSLFS
jgi:carbonic anhydrase